MNAPDIKKLITGFLLLAVVTSSAAFFFGSLSGSSGDNTKDAVAPSRGASGGALANAFVEQLPSSQDGDGFGAQDLSYGEFLQNPSSTTGNLTDDLTSRLAKEMIDTNPGGPSSSDGTLGLVPPNADALLTSIDEYGANANIDMPNWESDFYILAGRLKIIRENSAANLSNYKAAFGSLVEKNFETSGLSDVIEQPGSSLSDVVLAQAAVDDTIDAAISMSVPEQLADFHTSYLRLLVYQDKALDTVAYASEDPLKASLIVQANDENYNQALSIFQTQFMSVAWLFNSPESNGGAMVLFNKILGIRTTYAAIPFSPVDIVVDLVAEARRIWEWAKKILLDTVRDRIVHRLVQQTIDWVQGGYKGSPQFVNNWKSVLKNAGDIAAGEAINRIAPGFCNRSFGPLVRLQLESTYLADAPITCTLEQVVSDVKAFYADFRQGGWLGYGATILPSGNYFGQLFEGSQIVALDKWAASQAKDADAKSSQGFASTEVCVKFVVRNKYKECLDDLKGQQGPGNADPAICYIYPDVDEKICTNKEVTTPGQALGQNVYNALGAPIQRIVNADDIRSLISAFINSALNKLTKLVKGKPDKRGLLGLSGNATTGTGTGPDVDPDTNECAGKTGDALVTCFTNIACAGLTGSEKTECISGWKDVNCQPKPVNQEINLESNLTFGGGGGGGGGGGEASLVAGSSIAPGDPPPVVVDFPDGVGGTINGGMTVTKYKCTGGSTPPSGGGDDCSVSNVPTECLGKCRDQITGDDFCFLNPIRDAQQRVEEIGQVDGQGGATVGIIFGPYGGCSGPVCIRDTDLYKKSVAEQGQILIPGASVVVDGDEVCATGECHLSSCSKTRPGVCISGQRTECTAVDSSSQSPRYGVPNAICPP